MVPLWCTLSGRFHDKGLVFLFSQAYDFRWNPVQSAPERGKMISFARKAIQTNEELSGSPQR